MNNKIQFFREELPEGVEFEVVGDVKKMMEEQKKAAAEKNGTAQGENLRGNKQPWMREKLSIVETPGLKSD